MGEFFVLAKFQGLGIGEKIVKQLFERFPGVWEYSAMPENSASIAFIRKMLTRLMGKNFIEKKKNL